MIGPLSFRLRVADKDDFDGLDVVSVSSKITGYATWDAGVLTLEWAEVTLVQEVSFDRIRDEAIPAPPLILDVPNEEILDASVVGRWWRPRLRLVPRHLGAFAAVPGAHPTYLDLFIARRDRPLALTLAAACIQD